MAKRARSQERRSHLEEEGEDEEENRRRPTRPRAAERAPPDSRALFLLVPPSALCVLLKPHDLFAVARVARAIRKVYGAIFTARVDHVVSDDASLRRALGAPNVKRAVFKCGALPPAMPPNNGGAWARLTHLTLLSALSACARIPFPASLVSLTFNGASLRGLPPGLRALNYETAHAGALSGNAALALFP